MRGILTVPEGATSMVIFSHGSGSSRYSPRNAHVAEKMNECGMATLLIDLLTQQEDRVYENRFDIELLTKRLMAVTRFIHQQPTFSNFSFGYFGASTGAASALNAAARLGKLVSALVARGGRPDLASVDYGLVKTPTLLIVGGLDVPVIYLNEKVYHALQCEKRMVVVEGATHLFEEEGKLEEVSRLAANWFERYLTHTAMPKQKH